MGGGGGVALPDNGVAAICNSAKNKHTRRMTGNKQNAPLVSPEWLVCVSLCVRVCAVKVSKTRTARQSRSHAPTRPFMRCQVVAHHFA